ncbi:TRAUB-domain-containing protein [Atractiella rhizophila]|nr:TRAUB-domain-containing protein [Atractiella rhizophila]
MSLKSQLADLLEPGPPELDPESANVGFDAGAWKDDGGEDLEYFDPGTAKKRDILNPYGGKKVSRKELEEMRNAPSESESGEEEGEEDSGDDVREEGEGEDGSLEEEDEEEEEENWKEFKAGRIDEPEEAQGERDQSPVPEDDPASKLASQAQADLQKALDVKKQLRMWDDILQLRIRFQPILEGGNKLLPAALTVEDELVQEEVKKTLSSLSSLEDALFTLRSEMLLSNESLSTDDSTRLRSLKRKREDGEEEEERAIFGTSHALDDFHPPIVTATLTKWSAKISTALSFMHKGQKFKSNGSGEMDVVEQIEEMLNEEGEEMMKRSRRLEDGDGERDEMDVRGEEEREDVYVDSDWYRHLLREVVEERLADLDETALAHLSKKKRKTVDRKASKGRRIRYQPVEKLKGFMIPIPLHRLDREGKVEEWSEHQISEVFKGLPGASNVEREEEGREEEKVELGGFRLFG